MKFLALLIVLTAGVIASPIDASSDAANQYIFQTESDNPDYDGRTLSVLSNSLDLELRAPHDHSYTSVIFNDKAAGTQNALQGYFQDGLLRFSNQFQNFPNPDSVVKAVIQGDPEAGVLVGRMSISPAAQTPGWSLEVDVSTQNTYLAFAGPKQYGNARFLICNRPIDGSADQQSFDQPVLDLTKGGSTYVNDCTQVKIKSVVASSVSK